MNVNDIILEHGPAHEGVGMIHFARLFTGKDLKGPWNHIDWAVVPAGCSIGEHTHGNNEEMYFVVDGTASMTLDGRRFPVKPGHVVVNRPGGTHSLYNEGPDDVRLLVVEIHANKWASVSLERGHTANCWICVDRRFGPQRDDEIDWADMTPNGGISEDDVKDWLRGSLSLTTLANEWSARDPHIADALKSTSSGLRIMRQDPVECLFSFICSQNNNVARISQLVHTLRSFGPTIGTVHDITFHSFPDLSVLASPGMEAKLQSLGFGYRSSYVAVAARELIGFGGSKWIRALRDAQVSSRVAREELMKMRGVGPKVADCVALFSLDKLDVVPVDVHVWRMAQTIYLPALKNKPLNASRYQLVQDHLATVWGDKAGWAHSVMFNSSIQQKTKRRKT